MTLLAGVLANTVAVAGSATAVPVGNGTVDVPTVNSCNQDVPPGHYACFAERRTDVGNNTRKQLAALDSAPPGYSPAQLQDAYGLTSAAGSRGSGERVFVVDAYDDPTAEADLAVYRSQYGLSPCTTESGCFRKLNQAGATSPLPAVDSGWSAEIALDLQMVSAICPNCSITLIEANSDANNLFAAAQKATSLGARFVSMSWGGKETGAEARYDSTNFAATGVVYAAATGDDGYGAGVMYPATSPNVVAVGGTSLQTSSTARGWTEMAWHDSDGGSGSGCSASESKPSWQSVVPSAACNRRANADVSAVADPGTGVAVYNTTGDGGWGVFGGTSAATPIIAATYALAGLPAKNETPAAAPYRNSAHLNDVTSGSTGTCSATVLCTAGTGWDGPTGLGTPNGVAAFTPAGQSQTPAPATCASFTDVSASNQFCGDIQFLVNQGIAVGYADHTFKPATSVSRQAMASFLFRYANPGATGPACTSKPFTDVPVTSPFCADIAALKKQGAIAGYADGGFHPSAAVSRQATAAFLYRLANPGSTATACTTSAFNDVAASSTFCGDIAYLVTEKVTTGYRDGGFHPTEPVSRQAMAAFLHRLSTASH